MFRLKQKQWFQVTEGICVYPNVIAIPLMPNSGLPTPPVGMLEIDIKKIEGLKGSGDLIGKGDPYIRMSVLQLNPEDGTVMKQGPYHQTAVKSGKKPVFNEFKRVRYEICFSYNTNNFFPG